MWCSVGMIWWCLCCYNSFVIIIVNGFVVFPVTTTTTTTTTTRSSTTSQTRFIKSQQLQQSLNDNSNDSTIRKQQQQNQNQQQYSIIDTSSYDYYDEQKPRRRSLSSATTIDAPGSTTRKSSSTTSSSPLSSWKSKVNPWNDWGVERQQVHAQQQQQQQSSISIPLIGATNNNNNNNNNPIFPCTYTDVAHEIVTTCINVLYNTAALDPNIVQNAYVGTSDIYRHRPTHIFPKDTSRIGIEIDTPSYLQHSTSSTSSSTTTSASGTSTISNNEQSLRYLSLLVASTFSITRWDFDNDDNDNGKDSSNNEHQTPVFIYYNTVQQALYASQQLQQLQAIERYKVSSSSMNSKKKLNNNNHNTIQQPTKYDNIIILSLQDPLPIHLIGKSTICGTGTTSTNPKKRYITAKQKKMKFQKSSNVDPSKGIVIIIQPTDYNNYEQQQNHRQKTDFSSSNSGRISTKLSTTSTAAAASSTTKVMTTTTNTIPDAITNVQCIVATAAVQQIPVIMISPRFIQNLESNNRRDQSGYQQSSIYGGYEPPDGPTPWLLRDFSPPALCWIGNALQTSSSTSSSSSSSSIVPALSSSSSFSSTMRNNDFTYSRVSLFQSVLYPGHSWHLFAAKECQTTKNSSSRYGNSNSNDEHSRATTSTTNIQSSSSSSYEYLCSTRKASGRPTRDVLRRLLYEFASYDI